MHSSARPSLIWRLAHSPLAARLGIAGLLVFASFEFCDHAYSAFLAPATRASFLYVAPFDAPVVRFFPRDYHRAAGNWMPERKRVVRSIRE